MLISVIMANFNGDRYISDAIKSVIAQEFTDFEFIIIDDGSTDRSREIIEKYHRLYKGKIKPIYQAKNQGQGGCFNIAIREAKGKIISFLDSDDLWFPNKLNQVQKAFDSGCKLALHQHNLFIMRNGKFTKQKFKDTLISGDYYSDTRKSKILPLFSPTSGLSFDRNILTKVLPIPTGFTTCADGYLTRTSFCYGDVAVNNECLGAYRVHKGNNTYENPMYNNKKYTNKLLIPSLNQYYADNQIDLNFPQSLVYKIYNTSLRKILQSVVKESRFSRIDSMIGKLT
jgi:glycosyltransferase involved in cell wall biosynthesis